MASALGERMKQLTEGPILPSLIALSVPVVLANVLQTGYQLVDTFWVGRLGAAAVAAVSVSFPLVFLLLSLGGGLAIAGSTFVAQYAGARNRRMVSHVAAQTTLMVILASLVLTAGGYVLAPGILRLMGVEPAIMSDALGFMRISFVSVGPMFVYTVFQSVMRGIGEVKLPLYVVVVTVALNFVLNPLFIFGWGPVPAGGVIGSAYATLLTQTLAAGIGLAVLFGSQYEIALQWAHFKPDLPFIKRTFMLGLPASIEQSSRALGLTVMTFLVASFGTLAIATYGMGFRILSFVIIPALGLSLATATLVGQNIGAGNLARAERSAWLSAWFGFAVLSFVGLSVFAFAPYIVRFFVPADAALIKECAYFTRLTAIAYGFMGLQQALTGALRGAGSMMSTMVLAIVSLWVLQFPLAYILSKHTTLGLEGIWWAFPVGNIIVTVVTVLWFMQGSWKAIKLTEEERRAEAVAEEILVEEGQG